MRKDRGNQEGSRKSESRTRDDVHRLRGIKLKELRRDPDHFLRGHKMEQAHLEECFDADTLFYDIFFEPTNHHLVTVGPPLGNLGIDLKIFLNDAPLRPRVIEQAAPSMCLLRARVRRVEKRNEVLVQANGQQWRLSVPENSTGTGHGFTLCTVQKDNREQWIRDWIEHYRGIGVDRVVLYDNNSEKLPCQPGIIPKNGRLQMLGVSYSELP